MPAKKKELTIIQSNNPGMFRVKYVGGGQLPKQLSGEYSGRKHAQWAIEQYNTTR